MTTTGKPPRSVRVWSEVGITLAVSDDPPQFLKFVFGHERIAKNSTQEELRRTARLIDEFNESEIQKRVEQYKRLIASEGIDVEEAEERTARGRAKRRAKDEEDEDTWD